MIPYALIDWQLDHYVAKSRPQSVLEPIIKIQGIVICLHILSIMTLDLRELG